MEPQGILIYGELTRNNELRPVVKQLVTKARELKPKIYNQNIKVCVISSDIDYSNIIDNLKNLGADEVIIVKNSELSIYNPSYQPKIFYEIAQKYSSRIILIGATVQGKEIASYTATKFDTGLTADCTNLDIGDKNLLLSTRPTFGGQLTADILCKTFPQMATVQENVFNESFVEQNNINVIYEQIDVSQMKKQTEIIETIKKEISKQDITSADIVVSGGLGACSNEGFNLIREFAQKINGVVAGSREAFEKGYIEKSQQVGQTGKTIAPKIYIAIGISGTSQHVVGIKNSGKIIAINKDKNAPIFKYADYGIVGDLYDILKELVKNW